VKAKNAQKIKSKVSAYAEMFNYGKFNLYKNQSGYYLDSVEIENSFQNLGENIENLSLATYFAQLIYLCYKTNENSIDILRLLLNCIYFIKENKKQREEIKAIFELKFVTLIGYGPLLNGCCSCGNIQANDIYFSIKNCTIKCKSCLKSDDKFSFERIPDGVFAALNHICYSPFEKLFAFSLKKEQILILEKISENYLLQRIEINVPTLEFYKSLIITKD
ncbi:MAG: DNA repair protein RecO, partial [Oscillospiraceae bacterium]